MLNTVKPQLSQNSILLHVYSAKNNKKPRDVWQDKIAIARDREGSVQPASSRQVARPQERSSDTHRLQNHSEIHERTEPLTLHVKTIVKDRLRQIAREEGLKNPDQEPLSLSKVGGGYLERGLQEHMDMQYGALLEPVITQIIRKEMQALRTQLRFLLVRVAFDANQTRSLVTNIFCRQPGISQESREKILIETAKAAKANIFGKTPQLAELVEQFDRDMGIGEREAVHGR